MEKSVRIAKHPVALKAADLGAFGVAKVWMHGQCSGLRSDGGLNGLVGRHPPGVIEVQCGKIGGQMCLVRKALSRVFSRKACNTAGSLDGFFERLFGEVAAAGRSLAKAKIDGNAKAATQMVLDGFNLAHPGGDGKTPFNADAGLGATGAFLLCRLERCLDFRGKALKRFRFVDGSVGF